MARKRIRVSDRMRFTWFILAGFIFLFAPQNLTSKFQGMFSHVFGLPLRIGRNISLYAETKQPLTDVVRSGEYDKLHNHLTNIAARLEQEHEKVEKLSGMRDRRVWEGVNFVLADVITAVLDGSRNELIINRGQNDGLDKGMFVLGDNSIIGTISYVWSRTARVKLVTDSESKIPVKIKNTNLHRVMYGKGNNTAKIPSVKRKMKVGSLVIAEKKPGFLDVPMVTGIITDCCRNDDSPILWDITVKPACDIEKLKDTAVIIMNPEQ